MFFLLSLSQIINQKKQLWKLLFYSWCLLSMNTQNPLEWFTAMKKTKMKTIKPGDNYERIYF